MSSEKEPAQEIKIRLPTVIIIYGPSTPAVDKK